MTAILYTIGNADLPNTVKIGITNNIKRRIKEIQTGSAERLEVLQTWNFNTMKEARDVEYRTHARLSSIRLSGEWFDIYFKDAAEIIEQVIRNEYIDDRKSEREQLLKELNEQLAEATKKDDELVAILREAKKQYDKASKEWNENLSHCSKLREEIKRNSF